MIQNVPQTMRVTISGPKASATTLLVLSALVLMPIQLRHGTVQRSFGGCE